MRAAILSEAGLHYELVERPEPTPGFGEAVVRVHACSLNYRDLLNAKNPKQKRPIVPLSDGAGEVIAVGEGVTRVKVGDRVAANFFLGWRDGGIEGEYHDTAMGGAVDGMLAELVKLPADSLVHLPASMTFKEAACLPCAAVTAWNAMFETSRVLPGETVLTLGTGGVSVFAIQFARMAGARVVSTTSSDAKRDRLVGLGAEHTINYKATPDWEREAWEWSGGRGVDRVIEVGGAGTLPKSLHATRHGGRVSLIGVLTGFGAEISPYLVLGRSIRLEGIYVGSVAMFERMLAAMAANGIRPVIDRTFLLEDVDAALEHVDGGRHFGKVVVAIP